MPSGPIKPPEHHYEDHFSGGGSIKMGKLKRSSGY
jgi:hypothetical protein